MFNKQVLKAASLPLIILLAESLCSLGQLNIVKYPVVKLVQLFFKGDIMFRLRELNTALVSVLLRYHETRATQPPEKPSEIPLEERVSKSLDETPADLFAQLNTWVEPHKKNPKRGALLQYIMYNILALQIFSNPIKSESPTATDEPPQLPIEDLSQSSPEELQQLAITTAFKQLLNGERALSADDIKQQLIDLVTDTQKLLSLPESEEHSLKLSHVSVKAAGFGNGLTRLSGSLCLSGALLQEELFLPLGLRPNAKPKTVNDQIENIMADYQEVPSLKKQLARVTAEKTNLNEKNTRLTEESDDLKLELARARFPKNRDKDKPVVKQPTRTPLSQKAAVSKQSMFHPAGPAAAQHKKGYLVTGLHLLTNKVERLFGDVDREDDSDEDDSCLGGRKATRS